jgi:hypothetical protein
LERHLRLVAANGPLEPLRRHPALCRDPQSRAGEAERVDGARLGGLLIARLRLLDGFEDLCHRLFGVSLALARDAGGAFRRRACVGAGGEQQSKSGHAPGPRPSEANGNVLEIPERILAVDVSILGIMVVLLSNGLRGLKRASPVPFLRL